MVVTLEEGHKVMAALEDEKKENRRLAKIAEHYLLNYATELESYNSRKAEFLGRPLDTNSGIRGGLPGCPTEASALKSIKFDEGGESLRWLKAVEILRRVLGERKNIFLRVRIEAARYAVKKHKGRHGWIAYVQYRYSEELEKRFLIAEVHSEATIKAWWKGIIQKTVDLYKKI